MVATDAELAFLRRAYARQLIAKAGIGSNTALEAAFAEVRRERFLGIQAWSIYDFDKGLVPLPENSPVLAYQDVLFALSPSRHVNNGLPSLHACMLNALAPEPGQSIVHLGTGTGYYTAVLVEMTGAGGSVTAVEIDPVLGREAQGILRPLNHVDVVLEDAAMWPRDPVDRIYVNFAVSAPPDRWIEQLKPGGRLVFPLGVPGEVNRPSGTRFARDGGVFMIERRDDGFGASYVCPAHFIFAEGGVAPPDGEAKERLARAFASGGAEAVRSLIWKQEGAPERCWFWSTHWSLSYDEVRTD